MKLLISLTALAAVLLAWWLRPREVEFVGRWREPEDGYPSILPW